MATTQDKNVSAVIPAYYQNRDRPQQRSYTIVIRSGGGGVIVFGSGLHKSTRAAAAAIADIGDKTERETLARERVNNQLVR